MDGFIIKNIKYVERILKLCTFVIKKCFEKVQTKITYHFCFRSYKQYVKIEKITFLLISSDLWRFLKIQKHGWANLVSLTVLKITMLNILSGTLYIYINFFVYQNYKKYSHKLAGRCFFIRKIFTVYKGHTKIQEITFFSRFVAVIIYTSE